VTGDTAKTKIRTFLAVELSDGLRDNIAGLLTRLKTGVEFTGAHPKWVDPGGIHLTLKFFGQTSDQQRAEIVDALRPVAAKHAAHTVRVRGLDAFPSHRKPRVLWVGVKKASPLIALQEDVEQALEPIGWPAEDREFSPHLTLARIKSLRRTQAMMDVIHSHGDADLGDWLIPEMVLFQSTLRPTGAIYTPLERLPLGKA
jgi:2'-5' RNA ligase